MYLNFVNLFERPSDKAVERSKKFKVKVLEYGAFLSQTSLNGEVPERVVPVRRKEDSQGVQTDSIGDRPGEVDVIIGGKVEHVVKVYDPGFFPNPFSDFMQKIC